MPDGQQSIQQYDQKVEQEKTDSNSQQLAQIIAIPEELTEVRKAVEKVIEDIAVRTESPDYITLTMHVNLNTAKADLLPLPSKDNLEKLRLHFEKLPKRVQNVIIKSIPEDDMAAINTIWDFLDCKQKSMSQDNKVED